MDKIDVCPVCHSAQLEPYIKTYAQMHKRANKYNFDQCKSCSLVLLNPKVEAALLHDFYTNHYLPYRGSKAWGKYADMVDKSQKKLDLKRVNLLNQFQKIGQQTKILDVGCGQPTFLEACYQKYQPTCVGIDFSDNGWKDNDYSNLNLSVSEVKDLSTDLQPDFITMWHYLEHDYHPEQTLKKLREVSADKTTLVIEVPNFDSEGQKKYGTHWAGYHTPRHTFLFSPNNIKQLLKNTGWETVELKINGTLDPYNLYWMSEMELKGIDWTKNMEEEFWGYVRGMVYFRVKQLLSKKSWGVMTIIAQAN